MNLKLFWSLLVFIGALTLSVGAKAEPGPWSRLCMKPVSQDIIGTVVILHKNCDLAVVIKAFPQIDPATSKPLPPQVQRRSIYAANQERVEEGISYPRSVLRHCVRPGKPDPHADADELLNCSDGLMHYYAVAGAKILIPVDREYTPAEKDEIKRAAKEAARIDTEKQEHEKSVTLASLEKLRQDFEIRSLKLETGLAQSQARVQMLEPLSARGEWFFLLLALAAFSLVWSASATYVAARLRRRLGPVETMCLMYANPFLAITDLKDRCLALLAERDQWRKQKEEASRVHEAEKQEYKTKLSDLENLRAANDTLSKALQNDVYRSLEEIRQLKDVNSALRANAASLEIRYCNLKDEKADLEGIRSRQVSQLSALNRDLEKKVQHIIELEASCDMESPEERFVALIEQKDKLRTERDESVWYLDQFFNLAYGQKMPDGFADLPVKEQFKLAMGAMDRTLCLAHATVKNAESQPPPTISDCVPAGTASGCSRIEFDLIAFQSQLAQAPSHFVVDLVKIFMCEWAIRIRSEGELIYKINTMAELNDLNAFVCSSTLLGADQDLAALVGNADVSKVHLVSNWLCSVAGSGLMTSVVTQASG